METKKTEHIKKYYTWKGLKKCYDTEDDARKQEVTELKKKGVLPDHVFAAGFEYEEEAEAFRKGELDEYIRDKYKKYKLFDATEYDAVIYVDGSLDEAKDNKIASYGLIIFFRNETEPYIESGTFEDVKESGKYKIVRYDKYGKQKGQPEYHSFQSKSGKSGYISDAWAEAGELLGAKRALEICCIEKNEERKKKKILIIYDNKNVGLEYKLKDSKDNAGVEGEYREFLREIEDNALTFIKVDSHGSKKKNKHQYMIDAGKCPYADQCPQDVKCSYANEDTQDDKVQCAFKYPHAVYNDLVDTLAKAETGKSISPAENFNVFRAIPDEFKRFSDIKAYTADQKREHARNLVQEVLKKSEGIFRPQFKMD